LLTSDQNIPKIIWQTAKDYSSIYKNSKPLIKSWVTKNPEYEWLFMDDVRCQNFIRDNFNKQFYDMYMDLPLGVMRADVWRACIVYVYGGVYVDTDCECIAPISCWIENNSLVVAEELPNGAIANYAFAASPRHPALLSVINRFVELYNSNTYLDKSEPTPIQNFGQHAFCDGILRYLKENSNVYDKVFRYNEFKFVDFINRNNLGCFIVHYSHSLVSDNKDSWRKRAEEFLR
jgi:mannosyltransferase OCH1-like enzyme